MAHHTRTLIAAHRGGAQLWPENSMTAFRGALGLPVDQIETDVRLSIDGEPFIHHDPTLDRTTEGTGQATLLDWPALKRIRLKGTEADTIPHLDEVLDLLAPSFIDLRLELKAELDGKPQAGLIPRVEASLTRAGMLARTTITSFDRTYLKATAHLALAGRIWLIRRELLAEHGLPGVLGMASDEGISEIALHATQCELVGADRPAGPPRVGFYHVNDPAMIARAHALGASAFTTDRPDLAVAYRAEQVRAFVA